ncbi:hypothetical protein [Sinorhizobium saheli]|uniref:Uncharacterized protein n=1 Tax=Sinorhizobium saheli TaxID=36856 RepID=A0A178XG60_SINSA|nr:hypothetical protein [Sinorhizobium saheli]MQW85864.1 hypothetical protein [Sinorhizobium saheli]OAP34237.1 hypothetical protein ATB98_23245 [Sinorhizobium saheli]
MNVSMRTTFVAFVLSSALAGVAGSAFANGYYPGIDPHHPPGTQNRGAMLVPMVEDPYYVDTMPTGSIYVDPAPTGSVYVQPAPRTILLSPSGAREHYTGEYQGGGQGDYYQGIVPPAPVP